MGPVTFVQFRRSGNDPPVGYGQVVLATSWATNNDISSLPPGRSGFCTSG